MGSMAIIFQILVKTQIIPKFYKYLISKHLIIDFVINDKNSAIF
jgi:hypothetical protein